MRKNIILFAVLLTVGLGGFYLFYSYKVTQTDFASQPTVAPEPDTAMAAKAVVSNPYRGPLDDCLQNGFVYTRLGDMMADCTVNYVHFYPSPAAKMQNVQKRKAGELKIGSFNLFHLGDNQAPLKNFSLMASIINRWDVVGAQEFMPLPGDAATNNLLLMKLLQDETKKPVQFPYEDWHVATPGYLRLLQELQKLDSSWAVILQSSPAGDGSTGEMAGFYYRSTIVDLKEWDYCPADRSADIKTNAPLKNYACLVQVSAETQKLISRTAFAAYFKSDRFDFVGLTSHIRFRPPDSDADLKTQLDEICLSYIDPKKCKLPKDAIGRFYEVVAVAEQISAIKEKAQDKDVIFMGDFNLELQPKTAEYWKAALKKAPGFVTTQTELTTLSIPGNKLASNYDHFIFDPKFTSECDPSTVKSYNILAAAKATQDPVLKKIAGFYKAAGQTAFAETMAVDLDKMLKYQEKGTNFVRALSDKEKKDYTDSMAEALKRMKANDAAAEVELISDHIPIEMSCRTNQVDKN